MKKGFSPSRAAAQLPGPRPKPSWPTSPLAACFALASCASPAQAHAAAAPARSLPSPPARSPRGARTPAARGGACSDQPRPAFKAVRARARHPTLPLHFATSLPLAPQQQQQRPSCQARRRAPPASSSRTTAPSPDSRRQQFLLVDLHRLRSPAAAVVEVRAEHGRPFLSGECTAAVAWAVTPPGQLHSASRCGSAC